MIIVQWYVAIAIGMLTPPSHGWFSMDHGGSWKIWKQWRERKGKTTAAMFLQACRTLPNAVFSHVQSGCTHSTVLYKNIALLDELFQCCVEKRSFKILRFFFCSALYEWEGLGQLSSSAPSLVRYLLTASQYCHNIATTKLFPLYDLY